jgi:hypothetical protein
MFDIRTRPSLLVSRPIIQMVQGDPSAFQASWIGIVRPIHKFNQLPSLSPISLHLSGYLCQYLFISVTFLSLPTSTQSLSLDATFHTATRGMV